MYGFVLGSYTDWCHANLKNPASQLNRLKHNYRYLGPKPLNEISRRVVEDFRNKMLARGAKPVSVNRTVTVLSSVLSRAVEMEVIAEHPFGKLRPLPTVKGGVARVLTDAER